MLEHEAKQLAEQWASRHKYKIFTAPDFTTLSRNGFEIQLHFKPDHCILYALLSGLHDPTKSSSWIERKVKYRDLTAALDDAARGLHRLKETAMRYIQTAGNDNWWNSLSAEQKKQYIQKHPRSKYAKGGKAGGASGGKSTKKEWPLFNAEKRTLKRGGTISPADAKRLVKERSEDKGVKRRAAAKDKAAQARRNEKLAPLRKQMQAVNDKIRDLGDRIDGLQSKKAPQATIVKLQNSRSALLKQRDAIRDKMGVFFR